MHERHQASLVTLMEKFAENAGVAQQQSLAHQAELVETFEKARVGASLFALVASGAAALLALSDQRLKRDITPTLETFGGCPLYEWQWSDDAGVRFGLTGMSRGVLAQEVATLHQGPHARPTGRQTGRPPEGHSPTEAANRPPPTAHRPPHVQPIA